MTLMALLAGSPWREGTKENKVGGGESGKEGGFHKKGEGGSGIKRSFLE